MKKLTTGLLAVGILASGAFADTIAAPDVTDILTSLAAVFGSVLTVAVTIFGYKKIKSLL